MIKLDIYTDGACSGNPGPGGAAAVAVLHDPADGNKPKEFDHVTFFHRHTTNNGMEIQAAVIGARLARKCILAMREHPDVDYTDDVTVTFHTDSQYVYGTMVLGWRRNTNVNLWPFLDESLSELRALGGVTVSFNKVKGHTGDRWNELADRLAVEASQEAKAAAGTTKAPQASPSLKEHDLERLLVRAWLADATDIDAKKLIAEMIAGGDLDTATVAKYLSPHLKKQ